jgi:diguanylate cyclase (GGDEF)-like protein
MAESIHQILREATQKIGDLLEGQAPAQIECPADASQESAALCNRINQLVAALNEAGSFATWLSQGILHKDIPPTRNLLSSPFKELHARLLHLTWQTQQIAKGDYSQRVDFMGDFSEAINTMVIQLERRDRALNSKIQELAKQTAELSALNEKLEEEIDLRIHAEETIKRLAHHDSLTGLANRRLLDIFFKKEVALAQRYGKQMGLLLIDLNKFKQVNDHFGHTAGDEVLKTIASRIKMSLRRSDITCRIGGDEFVVVISDIAKEEDAIKISAKILSQIEEPVIYRQKTCQVGGSIGIAFYPTDGKTLDKLINNADQAMYHVKKNGDSGYQLFNQL